MIFLPSFPLMSDLCPKILYAMIEDLALSYFDMKVTLDKL